ncbi:hypothetical protein H8356DRAFT_926461 [Neocallimastix lanati (nom. inval.)]|uniref:Uncharacterized protein n=1 Tax=Neocallimastix californiae TaxID=1754190 RepID=A0A1Y2F835_9FUNG|nr:hypothetical protein H8356DRAFT_926461 [Neocallimastix sp. JGI-2020a]ORY80070.1 hypothetical protein LY90DRAFT_500451 [Neocallimastix californiae]|eukprot:ORY80070.1 hypothetical protein LY90DRAFT_500451 [Neocallimastix californiae]
MRDNPNENLIACELKLLQKSYYIINKEIKDDLENCIHFLNSINESENETNIQNITVIFPSLKKLYQEVKGLNRLIKINEDLYNSDKNDSQQIIDNKIECINKLQEELTDTKNTLMETEEKCNKLINEKQKVLKELENTTSQVEILEENINKKKEDLKEFLSEHNTLVNLYNTVVEEEKKKYKMLEQDYNFLRNIQMEYQVRIFK